MPWLCCRRSICLQQHASQSRAADLDQAGCACTQLTGFKAEQAYPVLMQGA